MASGLVSLIASASSALVSLHLNMAYLCTKLSLIV